MAVHYTTLGIEQQPAIARDRYGMIPERGDKPEEFTFHEGWNPDEDEWAEYIDECEAWIERVSSEINKKRNNDL